jgi:hypothetical protein
MASLARKKLRLDYAMLPFDEIVSGAGKVMNW